MNALQVIHRYGKEVIQVSTSKNDLYPKLYNIFEAEAKRTTSYFWDLHFLSIKMQLSDL